MSQIQGDVFASYRFDGLLEFNGSLDALLDAWVEQTELRVRVVLGFAKFSGQPLYLDEVESFMPGMWYFRGRFGQDCEPVLAQTFPSGICGTLVSDEMRQWGPIVSDDLAEQLPGA